MKCWIIEDGEYSDYHIVGIFSTRENAETALKFMQTRRGFNEATICEFPLDPGILELNQGLCLFSVRFTKDKIDVELSNTIDTESYHWNCGSLYYVWAKSPEHAIKIAAERDAQWQIEKDLLNAQS